MSVSARKIVSRNFPVAHLNVFSISLRNFSSYVDKCYEWSSSELCIEEASTPPTSWYTDARFLKDVEMAQTFRNWICIGRTDEVVADGSFIAKNICDEPIVVVNIGEGKLAAYFNVCRHHAAQICDEGTGQLDPVKKIMKCPYHGWEYSAIDGRLSKALQVQGCSGFKPKENGLISVLVDRLGPWIFVKLGISETGTLLGDQPDLAHLNDLLSATDYEKLQFVQKKSYHIKCNWKVFIDNYLDGGYHVPIAHPDLAAMLNMKTYRREGYKNFFLQSCESSSSHTDTDQSAGIVDSESSRPVRSSRIAGEGNDRALYLFHYPNLCINRYGKWMDTNIVWPDGPDNCIVDFEWYAESETKADENLVKSSIADSEVVQAEDIMLCERVQKGLKSSAYRGREGRYSPILETGEFMFHQRLYGDLKAASKPDK